MRYMLTLIGPEGGMEDATPEQMQEEMSHWAKFSEDLTEKGAFVSGEGLQESSTSTTLRGGRGKEWAITDGPYTESKEQLGGFYVIECENLDAAIEWAKKVPLSDGSIEVRPVMDYSLIEDSTEIVDRLFRHESGRAVASLIRVLGDFDLAEEAVQEAFAVALERWPTDGVPDNPGAWITRVARNKAIDRLRRERTLRVKREILEGLERLEPGAEVIVPVTGRHSLPDDRLRLIFTCCHPALAPEARVALTLRTLGGLTTAEIASAFLTSESTMAQRLVRAKGKIAKANIPYEVPRAAQLPERLPAVLATLYLVFNEGYLSSASDSLVRIDLADEAIRLARVLVSILPVEPEARALLALMLIQHSRRGARVDDEGELVLLGDQDRSLWDLDQVREGLELVGGLEGPPGPYTIQAAIAAEHARAETADATDWRRISDLYGRLRQVQPTPVVELNRAVAVAMADGPAAGLAIVDGIEGLDAYQPFHSTRADLLRRLERRDEAAEAYRRAVELTENPVQRAFLEGRLAELTQGDAPGTR